MAKDCSNKDGWGLKIPYSEVLLLQYRLQQLKRVSILIFNVKKKKSSFYLFFLNECISFLIFLLCSYLKKSDTDNIHCYIIFPAEVRNSHARSSLIYTLQFLVSCSSLKCPDIFLTEENIYIYFLLTRNT